MSGQVGRLKPGCRRSPLARDDGYRLGLDIPNPAGDHITWSFHNPRPMTVQVLDALGRTVISAGNYEHSLDISGLSSGSYLLELRDSNMRFCARFIKY